MKAWGFLKFGAAEHINQLVDEGIVCCNSVSYFRDLEENQARGDASEGLSAVYDHTQVELTLDNEYVVDGRVGLRGKFSMRYNDDEKLNLFCLYGVTPLSCFVDPRNYELGAASCYLPAKNWPEFIRRLDLAARKHPDVIRVDAGEVAYVSRDFHSGEMGPFRKYEDFAYQSEFRFVFHPGTGARLFLRLGSLADILVKGTAASFNEYITLNYNLLPARAG